MAVFNYITTMRGNCPEGCGAETCNPTPDIDCGDLIIPGVFGVHFEGDVSMPDDCTNSTHEDACDCAAPCGIDGGRKDITYHLGDDQFPQFGNTYEVSYDENETIIINYGINYYAVSCCVFQPEATGCVDFDDCPDCACLGGTLDEIGNCFVETGETTLPNGTTVPYYTCQQYCLPCDPMCPQGRGLITLPSPDYGFVEADSREGQCSSVCDICAEDVTTGTTATLTVVPSAFVTLKVSICNNTPLGVYVKVNAQTRMNGQKLALWEYNNFPGCTPPDDRGAFDRYYYRCHQAYRGWSATFEKYFPAGSTWDDIKDVPIPIVYEWAPNGPGNCEYPGAIYGQACANGARLPDYPCEGGEPFCGFCRIYTAAAFHGFSARTDNSTVTLVEV